ncbi:hypothetical protein PAV_1c09370 [Paenibacillus alvei DSM 29]|nr:hypothetical protein PAV_1c09370 [Paenibacillus alvei DSM 29]
MSVHYSQACVENVWINRNVEEFTAQGVVCAGKKGRQL